MPSLPSTQQIRFSQKLGLSEDRRAAFLDALNSGESGKTAVAITPGAPEAYLPPFKTRSTPPPWGCERVLAIDPEETEKPGSHADYHQGYYYPLDLSSVWETAPLSRLDQPERCLDLCASPGGKSILAQTRIAPRLHIANEVNPKRLGILRNNLSRSGFLQLYTQRLRPEQWSEAAPACFDLVLVDAPCSGQSLLAKGIENPGCFHPSTMKGNAKRQRGILHHAVKTLAPGGHLLYTTCTFAPEENEKTIAYLLKRYDDLEAVRVDALADFQSPLTEIPCYGLLPIDGFGSGGFSCLLRKKGAPAPLPELPAELLAWQIADKNNS